MIILLDSKKTLDKNTNSLMIKVQEDLGVQRIYLNTEKAIYNNPTAKIMQNEKIQGISTKIRNIFSTPVQHNA